MTPHALHYDDVLQQMTEATHSAFDSSAQHDTLIEYVIHQIIESTMPLFGDRLQIADAGDLAIAGRFQLRGLANTLEEEHNDGSTRVDPITLITLQNLVRRDYSSGAMIELDLSRRTVTRVYNTLSDHRNIGFLILHWLRKHDHMITVLDHMTTISAQYSRMLVNLLDDEYPQDRVMAVLHRFLLLTLPAALLTAIAQGKVSRDTPWEWQEPLLAQHVVEYLADNPPYEHLLEYAYDKVHSEHRTQGAQD